MRVVWELYASIKGIDKNKYYSQYDEENLESKYWMYDVVSFIEDNEGVIVEKKLNRLKNHIVYCLTFECMTDSFILNSYIKFRSGRFYTHSIIHITKNSNNYLYQKPTNSIYPN